MRRLYTSIAIVAVLGLGLGVWFGRTQLLAWYYVYQLSGASPESRDTWMARAISLDDSVVPSLMACLCRNDDQACSNAMAVLENLVGRWGPEDPRTLYLSCRLASDFPTMSAAGQATVLKMQRTWIEKGGEEFHAASLLSNVYRLVSQAVSTSAPAVRREVLALAIALLQRGTAAKIPPDPVLIDACQVLARNSLADSLEANRYLAVQLAQRPEIHLLAEIVPLLRDRSAQVRRAALLAVGPVPEVIGDDHLLYWLTDPDADVRQLCEMALRGRGLQENHIRMARLMADRQPAVRMQVIDHLRETPDLDPGAWLRRLSHDPAPAVRAAAVRAAANQAQAGLVDRIEQMAKSDPSPTVQQVARYYLSCQPLGIASQPIP
jgi:hypothetical protein